MTSRHAPAAPATCSGEHKRADATPAQRSGERKRADADRTDRSGEHQRADPAAPVGRSGERERADPVSKGYLPRLSPESYRGRAFVHWTLAIERRATGWLTPRFYHAWQIGMLHTCARFQLIAPVYTLMPDHIHVLCAGLSPSSDQRVAFEFLRRHTSEALRPARWQKQAHDHVLREHEREHRAFQSIAQYILENPVRAGLAARWQDYPCTGCCIAGYPKLDVRSEDYWELLWRIYNRLVEPSPESARSRSPLHADHQ